MKGISVWKINRTIFRTYNSCKREDFFALMDLVWELPGIFRKKRYLWNWIRPRDFYKMAAEYVIRCYKSNELDKVEHLIHEITNTAKSVSIKQTFVWNVTKSCNIVTPDTVPYMSPSRMENILMKDYIVYDRIYAPFIETIVKLREQNKLLEEFNDPE